MAAVHRSSINHQESRCQKLLRSLLAFALLALLSPGNCTAQVSSAFFKTQVDTAAKKPAADSTDVQQVAFQSAPVSGGSVLDSSEPFYDEVSTVASASSSSSFCWSSESPRWRIGFGALLLRKSDPDPAPLFGSVADPTIVLDASDFDFDLESGYECTLEHRFEDTGFGFEVRHFSIDNWSGTVNRAAFANAADATVFHTNPQTVFVDASDVFSVYQSDLANVELNLRADLFCEDFQLIVGMRHMTLDEQINSNVIPAFNPLVMQTDILTQVENTITGVQFGTFLRLFEQDGEISTFSTTAQFKSGFYVNDAKHLTTVGTNTAAPSRAGNWDDTNSVVSEILLNSSLRFQCFAIRLDYRFLWVESIASAGDQVGVSSIDPVNPNVNIDTDGNAFYHGFTIGGEWIF